MLRDVTFPKVFGATTILSLGTIDLRRPFHNERFIWPVGYVSIRKFQSFEDHRVKVDYVNEILDGGDPGPLFRLYIKGRKVSLSLSRSIETDIPIYIYIYDGDI